MEYDISDEVPTGSHMMAWTLPLPLLKSPLATHPTVTLGSRWQLHDELMVPHPPNAPTVAIHRLISSLLLADVSVGTLQMQSRSCNFSFTEINTIFFPSIQGDPVLFRQSQDPYLY